jgi:DNA-binding CsgD family transcriptional regulator/tetratricopeptide (TPR) repeat protein
MVRSILEREQELAELGVAAREAASGSGSIVLIEGEAGIGKSSLVSSIRSVLPAEARLLLGYCDDLATPRVLGPLRDMRDQVGTPLAAALDSGDRGRVLDAIRAELDWADHPTVMVVEDVHWADEATLDVLRFLVRRIGSLPAVLVLTYRDDELTHDHPLRQLLGLASRAPRVRRLRLSRLSMNAVRQLGSGTPLDPQRVYDMTSGNPFLVAEVVASGSVRGVPPSIAEAVRARLADLDEATRDAVEQLAVVPSTVERWLVESVVRGGLAALADAEQRGVLGISPSRVSFRHELTRRAVVDSLPAARRVAANQVVLSALLERHEARAVDLSRILHHAAEVGDEEVIVAFGPAAAAEAVTAGSHREAVAHGRLVLQYRSSFEPAELATILSRQAIEAYTIGLADEAVSAQEEAVALLRKLGDPVQLGIGLRWLSRVYWWSGARKKAEGACAEAIAVLSDAVSDGRSASSRVEDQQALAWALSNQAQLHFLAGHSAATLEIGERAVAMARELDDPGLLSHALNNVGAAAWDSGRGDARELLDESLRVALNAREFDHAIRAYVNIAWHLADDLRLDESERVLDAAIELAEEAEHLGFLRYMHMMRGTLAVARARWDEAEREAEWALDAGLITRCPALVVIGRARARRGDPSSEALLDEAWEIAVRLAEPQRLVPAGAALLEAAWLRGEPATAADRVLPFYDELLKYGYPTITAEVGYWLRTAGHDVPLPDVEHPYALLAQGRWREAEAAWRAAGTPYERALAQAESPDAADRLAALAELDALGAEPLSRVVRLRLRDQGVTRIPRGPTSSTRDNPAGLTDRQVEVVQLLADGLTNSEIAARLVLSVRTVDSHVAAVLDKLDARTRRDVAARAAALGLLDGSGR